MCFSILKTCLSYLEENAPHPIQTQVFIVVAVGTLHSYKRQEAQRDSLLEMYSDDELIIIDNDNEDDENETIGGSCRPILLVRLTRYKTVLLI